MIKEKRNDLENFIREQVEGPGALGYRFVHLVHEELLDKKLAELSALAYDNELLNTVPGALYSTGILFPVDKSGTSRSGENDSNDAENNEEGYENAEIDEDTQALNQMHPNNMALTCCLNETVKNENDLLIKISARHYTKIFPKELNSSYGLLLQHSQEEFRNFMQLFADDTSIQKIRVIEKGINVFIVGDELKPEDISGIRSKIGKIDKELARSLGSDRDGQNVSGYKEHLFRRLKRQVASDPERASIIEILVKIESFENSVAHIKDLLEIFDSYSYGLWECQKIVKEVRITDLFSKPFAGKLIYTPLTKPELKDIWKHEYHDQSFASLSLNIQLSQDTRLNKGKYFLKVQLVNTSTDFKQKENESRYYSVFNEVVNQRMFFGVEIRVESKHLTPYRDNTIDLNNSKFKEEEINKYLFREYKDYAIGHGCSVRWEKDATQNMFVCSEYLPSFEVPDIDPIPRNKKLRVETKGNNKFICAPFFQDARFLEFKWLSTFSNASDNEVILGLKELISTYGNWIRSGKDDFKSNIDNYIFSECEKDKERMLHNVDIFLAGDKNKNNLESFRLMNSAMFMQLWHSVMVKSKKIKGILDTNFTTFDSAFYKNANDELFEPGVHAAWRPFQIAFILLNLDGIFQDDSNSEWASRNELVDLVWFPTGGGKTEAYLGLIALTIINRRKKFGKEGGGTGVLMRYTLRLLTTQQFQRATMLIMGLELIRRWDLYGLGEEPIYIGLWVGKGSLPNSLDDLQKEYESLYQKQSAGQKNITSKIPFRSCPWCGNDFAPVSYQRIDNAADTYFYNRILLKCSSPDHKCSFTFPQRQSNKRKDHGPIPVSLCDEEIYQHPPALLFGTVDKFAQLAHKISTDKAKRHSDSRRLFGNGNWEDNKPQKGYLPPDLIIQDELHLLQGPLGSAVALFESAIDQLCTRKTKDGKIIRPKIISSTATTRNTPLQIMALFDRNVNLFPKSGVTCDDSFFAFYKRSALGSEDMQYESKRKYIGVLPTGRTQIWMQMRLAAVMMTHRAIFELKKIGGGHPTDANSYNKDVIKALDFYYPIVSYFNSLREVGKTESQIHTYIIKEIRRVFARVIRPGKLMQGLYTYEIEGGELTGRLSGEEVVAELDRVSTAWDPSKRFSHIEDGNIIPGKVLPDFIVATNMISVGIDVSRFNSIIMNSMPRNIAEYIQASSRVARDKEGLVLTLHHPFRARDISHYEKFIEFHEKMYSYVEPISITPFTNKSIERYLGLYLATILRHKTSFSERVSAQNITQLSSSQFDGLVKEVSEYFNKRYTHLWNMTDIDQLLKNLLTKENLDYIDSWIKNAINDWKIKTETSISNNRTFVFNNAVERSQQDQLYVDIDEYEENIDFKKWQIPQSLRVVEPEAVINIKPK